MSTMTKVFVVLSSVVSIVLSVLFISSAAQWDNWKRLAETYQTQRDAEMSLRQNTVANSYAQLALKDQDIQAKQTELAASQKKIQEMTDEITKIKAELTTTKNERLALTADRTKLQETLDVVVGQLKDAQKQNQTLLTQNMDLQTRNGQLNSRVLDLSTQVTIVTDQARNIQEKLYACEQKSVTTAKAAPAAEPSVTTARPTVAGQIRGTITEVNGAYAGVDIGEASGLVSGMTMLVYRGGTYLGEIVIDRVRPKEAGGKLASQAATEIRKGDMVWYNPEN
ncbi:MAG: hypothetical protein ACKVS9_03815 [Phycisphaerae bacterium]